MSYRSGIRPIDVAVLEAIETFADGSPGDYIPCSSVLGVICDRTGLGPSSAYEALLSLARPWVIVVPLVDTMGNIGDRLYGPGSGPRHTECRASSAGQVVLDAEARRIGPVPAGIVNGTMYHGGSQPPLQPGRVIAALRHLLDHPRTSDSEILAMAGPPFSLTGCIVTGDLDVLNAGHQIMLRQTGRISLTGNPIPGARPVSAVRVGTPKLRMGISGSADRWLASAQLVIESLPPDADLGKVATDLARHVQASAGDDGHRAYSALPIANVADLGTSAAPIRIAITLNPGTDPGTARDQIAAFDGVTTQAAAAYPAPLALLLRTWADQYRGEGVTASLARFEDAILEESSESQHG